jgi:3-dehydroquinate synthase
MKNKKSKGENLNDMQEIKTINYSIFINDSESMKRTIHDAGYSKVIVLVDENTEKYCLHKILFLLPENTSFIRIPSGESHKNISTCQVIWQNLLNIGADRHSLLINLGGGVLCDMGGFCAATYMRGIDFIQVPTTLLSMADASIGGKLGVDFMSYKNMVGLISEPKAVYVFPDFLETLPYEELRSGFAELLKHGLIADKEVWDELSSAKDISSMDYQKIIPRSINIKRKITEEDPGEKGCRKILNFGHTIGHAIESYWLQSSAPLLHGEAVAIGMVSEAYISYMLGQISELELFEIRGSILHIFGHHPKYVKPVDKILNFMKNDKKNKGDSLRLALLDPIGKACFDKEVSQEMIINSLIFYKEKLAA